MSAQLAISPATPGRLRAAFAIVVAVAALALWPLAAGQPKFALHVAIMVVLYASLAMSMNLMLRMGQLSLAHGALFGLGAYTSAILTRDYGWPMPLAFLAAGLVPALVAFITGPVFMRIKGVHFALLTFALGEVVVLCFVEFNTIFGGNSGFGQIPAATLGGFLPATRYGTYLLALGFGVLVYLGLRALYRSELGVVASSLHLNEALVTACGLEALRFRVAVFALSACIAGWTGSLYAHYQGYISPDSFGFWTAVNAIIMNVLGGAGVLIGAVIGALILIPLPELLRDLQQYQRLIYGVTLMALLLFMPQGLSGLAQRIAAHFRKGGR